MSPESDQATEFVFYINGEYVPMSDAKVSVLDSMCHGDSVFDTMRTANRTAVYRIDDHIERLYCSLRAADIDPGIDPEGMKRIILEVLDRNMHLLGDNDDAWIIPRVSSGSLAGYGDATVIVMFVPLPFMWHAKHFKTGVRLIVPTVRQVPPECMDPKIKYDARLFMHMAEREVRRIDPEASPLMLDLDGNVAELTDANFFIVSKGEVLTPPTRNVLPGISRKVVLEICGELRIPAHEKDFQLYDVYNADEAFRTGTSYRMLPVSGINMRRLWPDVPGPITQRLLDAYNEEIGLDIAEQYLCHLNDGEREELEKQVSDKSE